MEAVSAEVIHMEALLRAQFVYDRVPRPPAPGERKDLTDFAHGSAARVLRCRQCCALRREETQEPEGAYADDPYDGEVMERLLPRYAAAFAAKATPYRSLVPERARVLEIGPHLGGFLQTARDWGWDAVGVDVGKDTVGFMKAQGLRVLHGTIEDCGFEDASFDGVFIWNCFEQVPEPGALLGEVRRVLRPGGIAVLRVPNAAYYTTCRDYLAGSPDPELTTLVTRALAYSNLLAWPYLYGYTDQHLERMAGERGFVRAAALNSELIILPFPELPEWIEQEKRTALAAVAELSAFERLPMPGSWIEVSYRAA